MKTAILAVCPLALCGLISAGEGVVAITSDYPGGNVKVSRLSPGRAEIEADLRDTGQPWFYWNFEATATEPGSVRFLFPVNQKQISAQGPAVSLDGGKSWRWLGREKTSFLAAEPEGKRDSFSWNFTQKGEKVRFAQGFPYQKADLDKFLEKYGNNPNLKVNTLTKTRKGASSPLLVIAGGKDAKNILLTARHHACEAIASYALEGFLEEALSDTPMGRAFREKYALHVVPFVDLDGVEAGDQGKGRKPHDHNRDYGIPEPIYPEIRAINDLEREKRFFLCLDLHAPSVRDDIHEAFYFDGFRSPENNANTVEFAKWLAAESPGMIGNTLNLLKAKARKPSGTDGVSFAHHFGASPDVTYCATIEIPYAKRQAAYDFSVAREYGRGLLRAMMRMEFRKDKTKRTGYDDFMKMGRSLNGSPANFIRKAEAILNDPNMPQLYKMQAKLRLGWLYPRMRKYDEAIECDEEVMNSPWATARQKAEAAVQKTEALCADPVTPDEELAKWEKELGELRLSGLADYNACEALYQRAIRKKNAEKAYETATRQLVCAPAHFTGKVRNRIAAFYLAKGDREKAAQYSRETAAYLRKQLIPRMPPGIFSPQQAEELVNALLMIPDTPKQEIVEAANLALNHKYCQASVRKRLNAVLQRLNAPE